MTPTVTDRALCCCFWWLQVDWVALYVSQLPIARRIDAYANFIVQVHLERRDVDDKLKCLLAGEQCVCCARSGLAHVRARGTLLTLRSCL